MNLRLRLIVVFFLLSVVPVGALTYYSYTNNLKAVRDAAEHEAQTLAAELSQRMELVTAQLSLRVGRLMELPAADQIPDAASVSAAATAASNSGADADAAESEPVAIAADQARDALGDLAMLLNNLEIYEPRGRGRGGPGRGGRGPFPPPDGRGGPPPGFTGERPPVDASRDGLPSGPSPDGESRPAPDGDRGAPPADGSPRVDALPPENGANPERRGDTPPSASNGDPDRILIDMAPIRREIVQQYVPDGQFDQLTPEERGRIFSEVNRRMLDIRQGIEIVQQTVAERAASAAAAADAVASSSASAAATPSTPSTPSTPRATPAQPTESVLQRRAELSGGRLGVSLERDGELVSQVSADINLPNLLSTVFTAIRRESGEVPFAVTADGRIHAPSEEDRRIVEEVGTTAGGIDAEGRTAAIAPDWIVATTPDPTNSVARVGIARPLSESIDELQRTTVRSAALGLGFIALALIGIVPLAAGMTKNLSSLSEGVRRIAQGDYSARVSVRSRDEVGRLAEAFNQMAADVERHQRAAVEQERIRRELELGRQIQHDMLPRTPLRMGLTEVKGVSVPAREVGGDFFNYFRLPDGNVALLVGDVSGKGVGAALLMANIQAALRTRLSLGQDLASLAQELDVDIERSTPGPVYATLFVGIFEPERRRLRCVNAGHNPQYVLRHDRRIERMESTGRPIGLFSGGGYVEQAFELDAGDVLFFYTDGCVEAENARGEMFGAERLEAALTEAADLGADDVLSSTEAAISGFRSGVELQDDATMMVVKVG